MDRVQTDRDRQDGGDLNIKLDILFGCVSDNLSSSAVDDDLLDGGGGRDRQ